MPNSTNPYIPTFVASRMRRRNAAGGHAPPSGIPSPAPFVSFAAAASLLRRRRTAVKPPLDIDNEVSNYLSTALGVEVYPETIPQDTNDYPVLVYTVVDGDYYYRLSGQDGLTWIRYQFDSCSRLKSDVGLLNERLRLVMLPFMQSPGIMGAASIMDVTVHRPASGYTPTGTAQDNSGVYRRMSEYTIYFKNP